ncbi:hypothetical protein LCGC14_0195900 [marine sediment metagenome]|uniref:Uncharacterized protein n=1 Tax=marine sediment metagenome TaxID=412755 RepID=A0A0F9V206_9ZZZZ
MVISMYEIQMTLNHKETSKIDWVNFKLHPKKGCNTDKLFEDCENCNPTIIKKNLKK